MSKNKIQFDEDFSHLQRLAKKPPKALFNGAWSTLELQPDAFSPQRFTIGVVVQTPGERLHFKLLDDFKKFECIYRDSFPQKSIREIMTYAEELLRKCVHNKTSIPEIEFSTNCLSLSKPLFISGDNWETTIERLFKEVVAMAPSTASKSYGFESIDTPHARKIVNDELKRIANLDYDRIVNQNSQGVLLEEAGEFHHLDLNLITTRACGSVISAVYKSTQSVELNLLKSSRDLTTYSRVKDLKHVGLFLLTPDPDSIDSKDFKKIENVIDEYEWKLEQDGFQVVSLPSPIDLATEIYNWAKPTFA
ncbi:hypothetical protein ICN18_01370 [Polynucleobacter sp. Ross1-W9]|uniref:hypothetical protein n=1 Tax=Polynucleobacter parvulilacunae TaxID=1855631 RepID=UPI001C0CCD89|nr:hypothetical protein [Polynucleobacter parvulilacunae]MBU3556275.1 hypothetical protein [Polynucleobacter parvulilacunae]